MDLRSIYISNGVGIFMLLILYYASRAMIQRHRPEDRVYSFMVFCVALACFMEAFSYTLDGRVFPGSIFMNYVANTYLFTVNLLMPFCVLVYVDLGLYGDTRRIWQHYKPQIVIGLFMYAVNVLNFFVPVNYRITAQNVYVRLPFSYAYYFVILYYSFSGLMLTRRYERENGTRTFFSFGVFLMPILVGAGLQFMFYGLSLAWMSSALGLVGLFMMQQNELAYVDALVDTYNRQYLSYTLSAWISRGKPFAGVMVDVDHFKYINDHYGHSEGDAALKAVTDILKGACRDHEWVFRFAGDEFIVLKQGSATDGLRAYMDEVNRRLEARNRSGAAYPLTLSYGVSVFHPGSVDAFMKDMDVKMYAMKAAHHSNERGIAL